MPPTGFPLSCIGRLRTTSARFVRCEDGGATIWNLTWLLVFAGMAGLSIDSSNGYRNIAISQSTSDAASLAGAMELENPQKGVPFDSTEGAYDDTVKANALEYAGKNMPWDPYGQVLMPDEIFIGNWSNDDGERRFTAGHQFDDLVEEGLYASVDEVPVNAVRVYLFQDEEDRGNGVATSLMHMVGMPFWNVVTTATAVKGYYECYDQGFMAGKKICQTTNSDWYPGFCMYGNEGIKLQPNNTWGEGSVAVMPDGAVDGIHESNKTGEPPLSVSRSDMDIPLINEIPEITQSVLSGETLYTHPTFVPASKEVIKLGITSLEGNGDPDEVEMVLPVGDSSTTSTGGGGGGSDGGAGGCQGGQSPTSEVDPLPSDYDPFALTAEGNKPTSTDPAWTDPVLAQNRIYYYDGTQDITINDGLRNVVIVSHGGFNLPNGASLEDVTLISLADNGWTVKSNDMRFGNVDPCDPGGEVMVYTMGSMHGSAGVEFYGATLVAGGSISFSAQADGMYGIAAYAGGNLYFTAGNTAGGIGSNGLTASDACNDATYVGIPDHLMRVSIVD